MARRHMAFIIHPATKFGSAVIRVFTDKRTDRTDQNYIFLTAHIGGDEWSQHVQLQSTVQKYRITVSRNLLHIHTSLICSSEGVIDFMRIQLSRLNPPKYTTVAPNLDDMVNNFYSYIYQFIDSFLFFYEKSCVKCVSSGKQP